MFQLSYSHWPCERLIFFLALKSGIAAQQFHQRTRVGEIQDGFSLYSFQSIGTGCSFNDATVPGGYNCYIPSVCFWWPGFKEGWAGVGQQEPCLDGFVYCVAPTEKNKEMYTLRFIGIIMIPVLYTMYTSS